MITSQRFLATLLAAAALACGGEEPSFRLASSSGVGCSIELDIVREISGDDSELIGFSRVATLGPSGTWMIFSHARGEVVHAPANTGPVSVLTTMGEGPGEFLDISAIILRGDSLFVFDNGTGRGSVLSLSGELIRDFPLPILPSTEGVIELADGSFVATGQMLSLDHYAHPMVRFDATGNTITYFGRDATEGDGPLEGTVAAREIALGPGRTIIALKEHFFDIEVFDLAGELIDFWEGDVDWFAWPPDQPDLPHGQAGMPENAFLSVQTDEEGQLWILAQITDPSWEEAVEGGRVIDRDRWLDSRIQVLDLSADDPFVCSRTLDWPVRGRWMGKGIFRHYREDQSGTPHIEFYRVMMR